MKEIELSKNGTVNKGKYVALVDDDVFEEVNKCDWCYNNGYARNGKKIYLHCYIWQLKYGDIPEGLEVEHKDRNKLNCQISNLRLANRSENMCNKTKRKDNKSGFKGISKTGYKHENKDRSISIYEYWYTQIVKDGKRYTKRFPYTAEGLQEAIEWYKQKSLELQGKFSIFNKDK